LSNEGAVSAGSSTTAEKNTFNTWAKAVSGGKHPKTEADKWDSDYEVLKTKKMEIDGKKGVEVKCCSIRLSQGNRVYFYRLEKRPRREAPRAFFVIPTPSAKSAASCRA
jgi:hypothetical protein